MKKIVAFLIIILIIIISFIIFNNNKNNNQIEYNFNIDNSNKIISNDTFKYIKSKNAIVGMNTNVVDFTYYEDNYFDIYDYSKEELLIPSKIDDIDIKIISNINVKGVKTIKLEEGIESISDYCFVASDDLEKLFLPKSVKNIGKKIFGDNNVEIIYY